MTFSPTLIVRLLVLMGVGSTILAVGVSRLDPPQPDRRDLRPVEIFHINEPFLDVKSGKTHWVDSESGRLVDASLAPNDFLEAASCSPWTDGDGHRQVVGRWSSRSGVGPTLVYRDFGLARYSFPNCRLIDQIPTEVVPVTPPCWLPGTRARVVFAAGNGQLYRFQFESAVEGSSVAAGVTADVEPQALTWECPRPGMGEFFIAQIASPEDPRMGGKLLASIRLRESLSKDCATLSRMQLWWLEVDQEATRIIAAGPLIEHEGDAMAKDVDMRSPAVAALPDGTLALAYARHVADQSDWSIRLAPMELDAAQQPIPVVDSRAATIVPRCQSSSLAYSPDGAWLITFLSDDDSPMLSVGRFPTTPPGRSGPSR